MKTDDGADFHLDGKRHLTVFIIFQLCVFMEAFELLRAAAVHHCQWSKGAQEISEQDPSAWTSSAWRQPVQTGQKWQRYKQNK